RTVVVMWFAISCLMVTGPKEVSREHVVTVKLHQSFRGNEQTVYYLLNKCVHVASIKATRSHIRIEMEVAGDVVGCLDGCIALFTNYNPKFVHKDARTTLLSFYIPTHVNPHSESNGCRTDAKIYRKDADLLLDFYCSTEAPNKDDRSDWLLNMLSDDKNMHELFLSKEAIKYGEELKSDWNRGLLLINPTFMPSLLLSEHSPIELRRRLNSKSYSKQIRSLCSVHVSVQQ
uniref:Uncharacterized protein n=1 Tax=Parascaris univalens TaxID=6257 RepID=A0A915A1C2_PARUN